MACSGTITFAQSLKHFVVFIFELAKASTIHSLQSMSLQSGKLILEEKIYENCVFLEGKVNSYFWNIIKIYVYEAEWCYKKKLPFYCN